MSAYVSLLNQVRRTHALSLAHVYVSLSLSLSLTHTHTHTHVKSQQHHTSPVLSHTAYCLSDASRQNGLKISPRTHVGLASTVADCQFLLHLLFLDNAFDFKDKLALLLVWASKKVILLDVNHR